MVSKEPDHSDLATECRHYHNNNLLIMTRMHVCNMISDLIRRPILNIHHPARIHYHPVCFQLGPSNSQVIYPSTRSSGSTLSTRASLSSLSDSGGPNGNIRLRQQTCS